MTSTIKVNNIQNQCGANIINENSNTITIGASGDTIALASGASQTGFGREGSVNWQTGSLKTTTFTAVSGEGYFINQGSAITMNLPAGSAGAIVAVSDYARNFATYNLTISPNGSEKIGGEAEDAILNVDGQAATFVYVDSTKGWINVQNAEDTEVGTNPYIVATGGTITTVCTDYKVHTFTSPGTFCVSNAGTPSGSNEVSFLVVAGGGGGSANGGGGGGAGGYREGKSPQTPYTSSPLACTSGSNNGLPVAVAGYPVAVGGGGPGVSSGRSGCGSVSTFAGTTTITSTGGGGSGSYCGGKAYDNADIIGAPGGSGGGGGAGPSSPGSQPDVPTGNKGSGNTPSVSPSQGNDGGRALHSPSYTPTGAVGGGGGGGAGGTGGEPVLNPGKGGTGGVGVPTQITGSAVSYAGGGGGGIGPGSGFSVPLGSTCGTGGAGGRWPSPGAVAGTTNRGGGGGGGGHQPQAGANGGSGIVIIRYKFQN